MSPGKPPSTPAQAVFSNLKNGEQEAYSLRKYMLGGDQADDQMPVGREVVEVAGVDVDIFIVQQLDRKHFVATRSRNANLNIPASFTLHTTTRHMHQFF